MYVCSLYTSVFTYGPVSIPFQLLRSQSGNMASGLHFGDGASVDHNWGVNLRRVQGFEEFCIVFRGLQTSLEGASLCLCLLCPNSLRRNNKIMCVLHNSSFQNRHPHPDKRDGLETCVQLHYMYIYIHNYIQYTYYIIYILMYKFACNSCVTNVNVNVHVCTHLYVRTCVICKYYMHAYVQCMYVYVHILASDQTENHVH